MGSSVERVRDIVSGHAGFARHDRIAVASRGVADPVCQRFLPVLSCGGQVVFPKSQPSERCRDVRIFGRLSRELLIRSLRLVKPAGCDQQVSGQRPPRGRRNLGHHDARVTGGKVGQSDGQDSADLDPDAQIAGDLL